MHIYSIDYLIQMLLLLPSPCCGDDHNDPRRISEVFGIWNHKICR